MEYNSDAANAAKGGKMMKRAVWALLTIGALTLSASAQTWTEQGDAGDLPETAQSTGSGTLSQIQGSLDVNDVDMYAIYITDPAAFRASTVGGATWDTQLFLFDANGVGVVAEDDTGGFQSTINNAAGCITAPGLYYLAITRYNKNPLGCNEGGLWSFNDNNCPNGAEATSRVNSWTSSTGTAGSYTIFLTGVEGATAGDPADCPPFEGWDEFANGGGDAGDLPETAQSTGSGALTAIRGTIGAANDVDVYAIYISDPSTFSATTIGGTSLDTALWLFDEDGKGVVHNEDNPDATTGLQSRIDNRTFCITQPGRYYLAISLFPRRAVGCNEGLIWNTTPYRAVRCPDGPESTSRVAGWSGSTTSTGTYRIFLTGAAGATAGDPADCPPFEGWDEFANGGGDAGDLPETAQSTGSGAIPAIRGTIGAANDVDVYAIYISDPSTFSATTIGGTSLDTALWLFDEDGKGVVHNEDNPDATTGSQSRIDNRTFCISQPGRYYLAISLFGRRAAGCNEGLIWATTPARGVRCADGPESTSRVAGWSGSTSSTGTYRIFLTGAEGATAGDPADCPPFEGWDELANGGGDAGDLPATAQIVTLPDATPCETPVTRVRGDLGASDADMYVICITDPASFSATTVDSTGFDTQLWLFRCDGTGVVHNDDCGTSLQSCINNSTGCIQQGGIYLLAISRYNLDPVDANGQLIWNNTPFGSIRCPDGPGRANPIAGWTGDTTAAGRYIIQLQGAYFVRSSGCEEPPGCQPHNGDVDNNGCIDDADLLAVLFAFGNTGSNLGRVDVNCDQVVDDADLLQVLFNFGSGC
jgi:hypothetical protein